VAGGGEDGELLDACWFDEEQQPIFYCCNGIPN
jgi:hypothetical protein